jgi:peptidyl-prolyl cis-trans isomerase C
MESKRFLSLGAAVVCLGTSALAADQPAPVLVTVGPATMTQADVSRRIAALPSYQLSRYGSTPEEIKKRFVNEVLVPELLFGEEGLRRKLDQTPAMNDKRRDALRDAVDRAVREEALVKQPVTAEEIKKYFDDNKARYETPKRIRVWRVQVPDEATAKDLIAQAKGTDGTKRWSDFSREKSLDKATSQRNGDLGFVRADGTTDVPRVVVDKSVYAAVDKVADGTIVGAPLQEGDRWSVLWRRGSVEATKRTLEEETPSIRQILERRRSDTAKQELLANLRKEKLTEIHPELLSNIDAAAFGPPKRDGKGGGALDKATRRFKRDGGPPIGSPKPASSEEP